MVYSEGNFSRFTRERESRFTGLAMLASQKWWFSVAILNAPVRVYSKGNFSHYARERESHFTGLAMLASQKWWFSVAILNAPVRGI